MKSAASAMFAIADTHHHFLKIELFNLTLDNTNNWWH